MTVNERRKFRYHNDPVFRQRRDLLNKICKTKKQIEYHANCVMFLEQRLLRLVKEKEECAGNFLVKQTSTDGKTALQRIYSKTG